MLELQFTEFFIICCSCNKEGPKQATIKEAMSKAYKIGWVYVEDVKGSYCPKCIDKSKEN